MKFTSEQLIEAEGGYEILVKVYDRLDAKLEKN